MAAHAHTGPPDWLEPPAEQHGLKRYVETIRERLWIVILVVVLTTAAAVIYVVSADKVYEAQAELLVTPVPADEAILSTVGLITESTDPALDVETAAELVDTRAAATAAAERLGSDASPEDILARVSVEPIPESNIVAVVAEGSTPEAARDLANAFAAAAVEARTAEVHRRIGTVLPRLRAEASKALRQRQRQKQRSPGGVGAESLASQITELRILRTVDDPTIQQESQATAPGSPVSPRPALTIAAGALLGLALGTAAAFAFQVLDPRLRREEQVKGLYRLPILARIPREGRGTDDRPLTPERLSPPTREAYRTLRGTLAATRGAGGPRSILVTGPSPSEGKTTTALNLGASLALAGNRVILIEADLRRPAVGKALGVRATDGIVSVLVEQVPLVDALVTTNAYGSELQLLLADRTGPGVAELLSLPIATRMLEEAEGIADYVLIDSPPLTEVIDALPLARRADAVLIVVRLGQSRMHKIKELGELLDNNGIRPAGFTVVGVVRAAQDYYYYYHDAEGAEVEGDDLFRPSLLRPERREGTNPRTRTKDDDDYMARARRASSPGPVSELSLRPEGKKAFVDFANEKQPNTHQEKQVVIVYWLRHEAGLKQGITVDHVDTCYRAAGWQRPKDLHNGISVTARRKGWLDTRDYSSIQLTGPGEDFVTRELPTRDT